jgi:hypothetical protein
MGCGHNGLLIARLDDSSPKEDTQPAVLHSGCSLGSLDQSGSQIAGSLLGDSAPFLFASTGI